MSQWSEISELVHATGIDRAVASGEVDPQQLWEFIQAYTEYAARRDAVVEAHVRSRPNILRGTLRFGETVVRTALDTCWYFDELVVPDPLVFRSLEPLSREALSERHWHSLYRNLKALEHLRPLIEGGVIILRSPFVLDPTIPSPQADAAVGDVAARLEALSACSLGLREGPETQEGRWLEFRATLRGGFSGGWATKLLKPGTHTSPPMDLWTPLPTVSQQAFTAAVGSDQLQSCLTHLLTNEARALSSFAANSQQYAAAPLVDHRYEWELLRALGGETGAAEARRSQTACSLALPYLQGVPPERILEARDERNASFLAMRAELANMAKALEHVPADQDASVVRRELESKIAGAVSDIDGEMKAIEAKWRGKGLVAPVVLATGGMALNLCGAGLMSAIPALNGLAKLFDERAERQAAAKKLQQRPWYMLWECAQSLRQ